MRKLTILALSFILLFGLFANGSRDTGGEAASSQEITLWFYFEGPNHQAMIKDLTDGFNASQEEVVLSADYIPFSDFKRQLSIGMAASELPDLVIIDNPDHAAYAAMGLFADLTGKMDGINGYDQYFDGPVASTTLNGNIYGLPFISNCLALFYNEDQLKAAGIDPPETWADLKTAAITLSGDGSYGIGISAPNTEEGTFQFLPWLLSSNGNIEHLDSPESISSFAYLADLVDNGAMPLEVINWTQSDVLKQFMVGKLSMMVNGPWQIPVLEGEDLDFEWNVVKIPRDKTYSSVLGGENLGIVADKNVDAALKFLEYISQPEIVKDYAIKYGAFPPRKDVAGMSPWNDDSILRVFMDQMQYAMPRGPHPQWPSISSAISTALQDALVQAKTPEAAAMDAQKKIDELQASR